jgi:hypothetical protein
MLGISLLLIGVSLLAALVATWAIRKFTEMALSWKAAIIIGVINGIVSSIILEFSK